MVGIGFIKLYRSILKWEWYDDINTKTLFLHLLLTANYEDKEWRGMVIKKGSLVTSFTKLASETTLSVRNVRTSLNRLISTQEVTCQSTSKFTMITIENYSRYQTVENQNDTVSDMVSDKQVTSERHANDMQVTTTKEIKKQRSKELKNKDLKDILLGAETPSRPNGVISLTLNSGIEHQIYQEDITQWQEIYPAVDVMGELRKMKGWCLANPTKRKTSRGITKFINSWLSKEQDRGLQLLSKQTSYSRRPKVVEVIPDYKEQSDEVPEVDYEELQILLKSLDEKRKVGV